MSYNVLCFCSTSDFIQSINSCQKEFDADFVFQNVECNGQTDFDESIGKVAPSLVVVDFSVGKEIIVKILHVINSSPIISRVPLVLAVSDVKLDRKSVV